MKISEIRIVNYRQYKGENTVTLSTDEKKNFTIIQGDNGGGKSNFMNAIIWCIYGDEMFTSKKNKGRPIVNELALQEVPAGTPVEVSVTLMMNEGDVEYEVKRKATFIRNDNNNSSKGAEDFKVMELSDSGKRSLSSPEWFIEKKFIPKDLRGFFFFDGEKMDDYFEDTSKVKFNVQKIAQIDILENAIETLKNTISDINRDARKYQSESGDSIGTIERINEELGKLNTDLDGVKQEIQDNELEIDRIQKYLRTNSDAVVREMQSRRDELNERLKEISNSLDVNDANISSLIAGRAPIVFALQALCYSEKLIDEETQRGVLPPNIKDVFLKDLLDSGTCICGRDLSEGTEHRHKIEKLLEQLMPSDISYNATTGRYVIEKMLKKKDFAEEYANYLRKKKNLGSELEKCNQSLDEINEKLSHHHLDEIAEKEEEHKGRMKKLSQSNTRKGTIGNKIVALERQRDELQEKVKRDAINNSNLKYLQDQVDYAGALKELFIKIKEGILNDVREQLEEKTRNYFFNMIWKKEAFSDVCIKDLGSQYSISVLTGYGHECLGDLSAGEKQVLALSFTAALYSVSGYSVPVIIDTPLGRISGAPRDNIASALPDYLSETQVIMLATDTEYTDTVRDKLKCSVGAEYKIKHDEASKTSKVIDYE